MKDWHTDGDNNACQENEQNNNDIDNKRDNDYTSIEVNNVCIDENHKIGENEISKYSNKTYKLGNIIGNGSFGVVYEATCIDTSEKVAIKKVLQDPQYKNRELMIMKNLNHLNIIYLKDYYYTEAIKKNEKNVFLNVVMEYIPQTVHKYMKYYLRNNQFLPIFLVKLYSYQLCRALGYLHSKLICHRDLKPQNLLIDPKTHTLKLCDFGSAKSLISGQRSVSYICSRFYRAPELMLGSTNYTTHIDLWSLGCIIAEMVLGYPIFSGQSSVDQLVRIIQILGTPTEDQMKVMNPNYADVKFPNVKPKDLKKVFPKGTPNNAINFVSQFLKYEPLKRLNAIEALADPFFDEIRDPNVKLPKYVEKLPELFNFSVEEIREMSDLCRKKVLPKQNYEECQELNSTELNSKHSNGGKEINIEDGISSVNSCFTIER
ncbi:glycogen synthase kinase 3 [Plasmodium berghei]|uniref:Glycogen synthase kinase 3, putative n=2 Tax=Plasmodium berghei TaxID=5821 RepID=A0A509AGD2_PLABA|nr:glycogen synthase kinase 3, putative [Plasmodium berghei ANKA]CXI02376.1 glycogen synthase kinase 3 [Plasmodium berghei]SCL91949.1 glycogen synthase kinase 3 [Plasmodium berghei]SCM15563.1 glycogen synthase kinase 3 [Plasmodium berghei]SCM17355.1 glycogen synthase kinase 3 [Plasmodium berghei]SCN22590.1 glycogen synthase kinase 3 [Plasmodium berghei]|eukprot:XP_034420161.1 glycogen synthase kinase 3, putative [Plasmodium berghei ANKA]